MLTDSPRIHSASKRFIVPAKVCLGGWLLAAASGLQAANPSFSFNQDIRPILSDNCLACHGADPGTRKASLRLDTQEGLFGKSESGGRIVSPSNLSQSELWSRINSADTDEVMPPPKSRKQLTAAQKELLRRWIEAGAPWQQHWSLIPPARSAEPPVRQSSWVRNPIDRFILARLEEKSLEPAPEADRHTLGRRLALDLIGLPPTPEEMEAFLRDRSAQAFEKFADRLLRSAHYGEHRARYWLDAARYADTHGLHFDNYREIWPYRDWVIRAINKNLPFDRFTALQMAGDLMPGASEDDVVATGFHRCNMTTNEGGTIEEENLAYYANDRVTTTSWVWLGLTANCAACHDHKFDPITTRDFYSMAAFFRNTTQGGLDGNIKQSNPSVPVFGEKSGLDRARWKELEAELMAARKIEEETRKASGGAFSNWVGTANAETLEMRALDGMLLRAAMNDGQSNRVAGVSRQGLFAVAPTGGGELQIKKEGKIGPALLLKNGARIDLPQAGQIDQRKPFTLAAWVYVPSTLGDDATLMSRLDPEAWRGWELWQEQRQLGFSLSHSAPRNGFKIRSVNRLLRKDSWQHIAFSYDGSGKIEGLRLFFDGAPVELDSLRGFTQLEGSTRTSAPLNLGGKTTRGGIDGVSFQDLRIYDRVLSPSEALLIARGFFKELLAKPPKDWKDDERRNAWDYFFAAEHLPGIEASRTVAAIERERRRISLIYPTTLVQQEKADTLPMAHILARGQYDKPKDQVTAAPFAVLNPMPPGAPTNRLGLAAWLTARENPLTARVIVNRFWQELFGTGLVRTAEDFGIMGESPVNRELLDWLAVEFIESGWNMKHMFRLMITSAAYRQSAVTTDAKRQADPSNRYLSRGPRFRLDAETIRDYALAASGLLARDIGGPSVKPYQPEGVWEAVAMPESNTRSYRPDAGTALYRRSLYTFWKRAAPPAMMDILNAPSRESCTVRRERTNTPLQALVTLNDPQFIEAAKALAAEALRGSSDSDKPIDFLARRVLLRPLDSQENAVVRDTLQRMRIHFAAHPEDAARLISAGATPASTQGANRRVELAALTMVANQLFNLDEALNK